MSVEEEHVAHPQLYGAPAYARPPCAVAPTPLPLGPDDLPIAAVQTPQEQQLVELLLARPYQSVRPAMPNRDQSQLEARPLRLLALAGRLLRRAS
jgi:hypothetical protein